MNLLRWLTAAAALTLATLAQAEGGYQPSYTWLKYHTSLHVHAGGSTTEEVQWHLRIETESGVENEAEQRIQYSESLETLEVLEAWTQTPDGRKVPVAADRIRTLQAEDGGNADFSDAKIKAVIFPAVSVGAQLFLRYRNHQHTPYYPGHAAWSNHFTPTVRFEEARIDITHDAGVNLRVDSREVSGGKVPARQGDAPGTVRYAFTYRQDTAHPPERGRVNLSDFAPYVHATTFPDRAAMAAAYQARARLAAEPTPAIRQLATELTTGATTEREKVRRLYDWVRRHIRYVALVIGAGGYVPHNAQEVLDHRYGDCKDHVALLEALLRAVGIESSPALVNSDMTMKFPKLAVYEPFDHVITYVPSLDLYLDATSRFAPMGMLPLMVMDKPVLLTATGKEARTPKTDPSSNESYAHTRMYLQPNGQIKGMSMAAMTGPEQVNSRSAQFENLDRQQDQLAHEYLRRFGETGVGRIERSDPLDLDKRWEVVAEFELDPVVNIPGPSAMRIPIGLSPGRIQGLATTRPPAQRRFDYFCASRRIREEVALHIPRGVTIQRIPTAVTFQRGPLRYAANYRRVGQVIHVEREFSADRQSHTCTPKDDEDWAAFLRVLQRDLRSQVFIR